jgi:Xaa-Pro aminopeptidase
MMLTQTAPHFKARREALMRMHPDHAFLLPGNLEVIRNQDVTYPFRQESNFYYLTGFTEPEAFLLLLPSRMVLFLRKKDAEKELWEGERYGVEAACAVFGADESYPIEELDRKLPELLKGCNQVYYRLGLNETMDRKILAALELAKRGPGRSGKGMLPVLDPTHPLGEMRLFKGAEEIEKIRKVTKISAEAHQIAQQELRAGMHEFEIAALLDYEFKIRGCERLGYESIVAGGKNATCLHYTANRDPLKAGDLILIDAGGELDYYCADITRTFPVEKSFNPTQLKMYELVLKVQLEAIALVKPGAKLSEIHAHVCESLVEGFLELGLLMGKKEELIQSGAYKRFYPHQTSHWLGMDVHDTGLYTLQGESRPLKPGMVFTIEPGFYVQPQDLKSPPEYRGIGIRIEDDILVTQNGCEVLTTLAHK